MKGIRFHLVSILLAAAATFVASSLEGRPGAAPPPGSTRAEPIFCAGHDALVLRGRFIETNGNGVDVQGHCDVQIVDSHIVAGGVGVVAQGHGDVMIVNSYVEGGLAALAAFGNGKISHRDTTLSGATRTAGRGQIVGDGTASVGDAARSVREVLGEVLGDVRISLPDVEVREGSNTVRIGGGGVEVSDGTETVRVRPGTGGLRLETDEATLILDADVSLDENGVLRLDFGATAEVSDAWREAGRSAYRAADTDRLLHELRAADENGQLRVELGGDVLFDLDSTAIRPAGAAELGKLAHVLRQRAVGEVRLVGHTDSLGSDEHNLKLSRARAVAVMRWLEREEGIPARLMVGEGLGSTRPVAYNTMPDGSDNPEGRAMNRRVEIFFTSER